MSLRIPVLEATDWTIVNYYILTNTALTERREQQSTKDSKIQRFKEIRANHCLLVLNSIFCADVVKLTYGEHFICGVFVCKQ